MPNSLMQQHEPDCAPADPIDYRDALFEYVPTPVLVADERAKVINVNPAACELLDCSREEIIGKRFSDFFSPNTDLIANVEWAQFNPQKSTSGIFEFIRRDGQIQRIEYNTVVNFSHRFQLLFLNGKPSHPESAAPHAAQSQLDVQRHRQAEQTLRDNLLLAIAHDLRNPITAIKVSAQILLQKAENTQSCKSLANRILKASDRLDRMIVNLLDSSRLHAGKTVLLKVEEVNLVQVLEDAIYNLSAIYGDRFRLVTPPFLHGFWSVDAIVRIVENLATNAVKYGDETHTITIALHPISSGVELRVHNHGKPIPKCEQKELFRLFRRTSSAECGTQKGWGLGLVLIQGLSHALGGSVHIESELQVGTSFVVTLPLDSRPYESGEAVTFPP